MSRAKWRDSVSAEPALPRAARPACCVVEQCAAVLIVGLFARVFHAACAPHGRLCYPQRCGIAVLLGWSLTRSAGRRCVSSWQGEASVTAKPSDPWCQGAFCPSPPRCPGISHIHNTIFSKEWSSNHCRSGKMLDSRKGARSASVLEPLRSACPPSAKSAFPKSLS